MSQECDHCLAAPSGETPLIQQFQTVAAHLFAGWWNAIYLAGSRPIFRVNMIYCTKFEAPAGSLPFTRAGRKQPFAVRSASGRRTTR